MPVASGSSVPPWPAFWASNRRRMAPTAWVEVMPSGLSRISQPLTFSPRLRLAIIGLVIGRVGRDRCGLAIFRFRRQIARHQRIMQQGFDPVGLLEAFVEAEAQHRRHPEIDLARQLAAEEGSGAVERLDHDGGIDFLLESDTERDDIGDGIPEIR